MQRSIHVVLQQATEQLRPVSDSPRLDADILLAYVMHVARSVLYAWPERTLTENELAQFYDCLQRRLRHEPIAYIVGYQEFWSLPLKVTPATLIPRPETECLVECVLQHVPHKQALIADLGTGSGAIAIAIAHERPTWCVHAVDQSEQALAIAIENANAHQLKHISFYQGSWCEALPDVKFDAIVSNPPYIAEYDPHLTQGALPFEPSMALVSGKDGLDAIREIIQEAWLCLKPDGWLIVEHGFNQASLVRGCLVKKGYRSVASSCDYSGVERVTYGQRGQGHE